jgi:hypothetical protein
MNKKMRRLSGALAGACLYAFAAPALAQDSGTKQADGSTRSDREEAATTVPAWEAYGPSGGETLEETFFRLSRDFVTTTDESYRKLGAVPIWPRGEIKIGGFRILPFLREGIEWQDNYYKAPETNRLPGQHGRDSVWTHENEAGLFADTALMGGRLRISASVDSTWNVRYGGEAPPDTWDFDGQLGAAYRWPSGAWISGGLAYERRHDAADLPAVSNDFGRSTSRAFLHWGLDRDILFGSKIKWEFGVQTDNVIAQDKAYSDLDRTESTYYGKASYPFWKDTTRVFLLARYRKLIKDSSALNDGNVFGLNAGIEGAIPLRQGEYRGLRGQVSVGFDRGLYDNQTFRSGSQTIVADDNRTATTLNVQAALQYVMSPKTSVDLRYIRTAEFSFRGNYQLTDRVELVASHNLSRQLTGRVDVFYEHDDPSGRSPNRTIPDDALSQRALSINREGAGVGLRYAYNEWADLDLTLSVDNRNDHTTNSYKNYTGELGVTFYLNALIPKGRTASER